MYFRDGCQENILVFQAFWFWHTGTCSKGTRGRRRVHGVEASSGLLWPGWNCATVWDVLETRYEMESKQCATVDVADVFSSIPLSLECRPQFAFTWMGVQHTRNWTAVGGSTKFSCFYNSFLFPWPSGQGMSSCGTKLPTQVNPQEMSAANWSQSCTSLPKEQPESSFFLLGRVRRLSEHRWVFTGKCCTYTSEADCFKQMTPLPIPF